MIQKKFLCYQTTKEFQKELPNIDYKSIVFVIDQGFIYTHGKYFFDPEIQQIISEALGFLEDRINENEKILGEALNGITINGQSIGDGEINITKDSLGLGNVDNTSDANKPISTATQTALNKKVDKVDGSGLVATSKITGYDNHLINKSNPHEVTKGQVGLGNVDNTSDANKPVSTATQTELNKKVDKVDGSTLVPTTKITSYDNHLTNKSNPHEVTKSQLNLGNVDNTSDLEKPISNAVQDKIEISGKAFGDLKSRIDTIEKTLGAVINEFQAEIKALKNDQEL